MESLKKLRFINGNTLKLIAAFFMVIDHVGMIFFPFKMWIRAIGRLSMPLFAFAIAEGCRYTRNKIKHFFMMFILGVLCQIVYIVFDPSILYFGILFTFSFSTLCIYAMQNFKKCLFDKNAKISDKLLSGMLFAAMVSFVYAFCYYFEVDYGFWGCMMPVFASIFDFHRIPAPDKLKKLDVLPLKVLCMCVALLLLILTTNSLLKDVSLYAFLALPFLLLYNGEKGKYNMKYFFYIFYPAHLGIIQGTYIVMQWLK